MDLKTLLYETKGPLAVIRLHRPERMNAVNEDMYRELQQLLRKAESDRAIRVLIITGSVLKRDNKEKQAFCAGADLKEHASGRRDPGARRKYIELAHATTRMVYEFSKPVIAAINGPARGAGLELALNCDFILMADTATGGFPETSLGTFVGGGVTGLLPAMVGVMNAKELIYTGKIFNGPEAVKLGIALRSVPVEKLFECALDLGRNLAQKAPLSLKSAKHLLQSRQQENMGQVLRRETEVILSLMDTGDWREGIRAFTEKRSPVYKGN